MPDETRVGERIKRARLAKNLTLKDIERKAKVSATHVSEIERGLTSPTVGALSRIAEALGVEAFELLPPVEAPRVSVTRVGARVVLADTAGGGTYHRLSGGFEEAAFTMLEVELAAGASGPAPMGRSGGEEFFHVLTGVVEIDSGESSRPRDVLKEGDSIHLRNGHGRRVTNIGDGLARVLWVSAPAVRL